MVAGKNSKKYVLQGKSQVDLGLGTCEDLCEAGEPIEIETYTRVGRK